MSLSRQLPMMALVLVLAAGCSGRSLQEALPDDWGEGPAPSAASTRTVPDTAFQPGPEVDVQPFSFLYEPDRRFLYRDSLLAADPESYLEIDPLDTMFERFREQGLKCLNSRRMRWNGNDGWGGGFEVVSTRYVLIECRGNCDDLVLEFDFGNGKAWHSAMSQPFPMLTFKSGWTERRLAWAAYHRGGGSPPRVRLHQWGGSGDYGPGCDIDPMLP